MDPKEAEQSGTSIEDALHEQETAHLMHFRREMTELMRDNPELRPRIVQAMAHVSQYQAGVVQTALEYSLDDLTGLPQRRDFMTKAERALEHGRRAPSRIIERQRPLKGGTYMLIIDIDYFKQINDSLGHPYGDSALVQMANLLSEENREEPHRIGGEEFGLVLPRSNLEVAELTASRLVEKISGYDFQLYASDPEERVSMPITVSIGVAGVMFGEHTDASELYQMADDALYAAKESGRNRHQLHPTLII